jgi:undecaprenyl-diphosphatase
MNAFDYTFLSALNRSFLHCKVMDHIMIVLAGNLLLKGGVVMAAIWWLWFHVPKDEEAARIVRRRIIAGFCATVFAMGLVRVAHLALPFRPRPLNYPTLFKLSGDMSNVDRIYMMGDSSFPSDHAALFYSLAMTIFLTSRRLGILSFLYVTFFICFPRMYLLLHYPTDILVGGMIGIVCVILGVGISELNSPLRSLLDLSIRWSQRFPGAFYALMFVWSFSIADLFDSLRSIGQFGPILRGLLGQH